LDGEVRGFRCHFHGGRDAFYGENFAVTVAWLAAASKDGEPGEREDEGADYADYQDRGAAGGGGGGGVVVEVGCFGVVGDGEEGALGDCFFGHELAGVEFGCAFGAGGPVVEGDAEVFGGGDAEGEGASGAELVLAGGDGGHGFGPGGGGSRGGHWVSIRLRADSRSFAALRMTNL